MPEIAFAPAHAPDAAQEVALVVLHVRFDELPEVMELGVADSTIVGVVAGGVVEPVVSRNVFAFRSASFIVINTFEVGEYCQRPNVPAGTAAGPTLDEAEVHVYLSRFKL